MLSVQINEVNGIALFEPHEPLSESDFKSSIRVVDPWIEKNGRLNGLIIYTKSFSGWESFGALSSHVIFIREHHEKIVRVAFVTDSAVDNVAEKIASHWIILPTNAVEQDTLPRASHR